MDRKLSFKPLDNLSNDIPAALVVFLVALPLCLGIALASGAPLFSGLIAGIVGGIVAGALSKSSLSVSGPAAGLATIVFAAIQDLESFRLFLLAVVIAGAIQIALGYLRAGTIGHFFPVSVIKGMLAAIGLILILKQVPHAFGYDADFEGDESFFQIDDRNTFTEIIGALEYFTPGAIVVSVVSLLILAVWPLPFMRRFKVTSVAPAALVVVIAGVSLNWIFQNFLGELAIQKSHLVDLGGVVSLSNVIVFPDFTGLTNPGVYRVALTIAVVASIESLLSIEATDKLDLYRRITPLNAELKAQGLANIVSGLIGGLPITAVIVRSSANVMAGGRTKAAAILHGIFLLVVVASVPFVLQLIPLASLAGVLLMVGYKLNTPSLYKEVFRKGIDQFLPFLTTIVAILFSDLLTGIAIGVAVALFFVLKTNFHSAIAIEKNDSKYILKFTKDVSFMHKAILRRALERFPHHSHILIDGTGCKFLDADIIETIEDFIKSAPTKSITVTIHRTKNATTTMFRLPEALNGSVAMYREDSRAKWNEN